MYAVVSPRRFTGTYRIPASKSHTIRRLLMAALAEGVSEIDYPLDSLDTRSCATVSRLLGAELSERRAADPGCPNPANERGERLVRWTVRGISGRGPGEACPALWAADGPLALDVGNSGTTLYLALAVAGLGKRPISFTGDAQIARRSAGPLLEALRGLGIRVEAGAEGCVPITVQGPWQGGRVRLPCPTSQYLSALLLAAPLAPPGTLTVIEAPLLNEKPYIDMTLAYLDAQGIPCERAGDYSRFRIPGGGAYRPMNGAVPGDFSSAAFPGAAAAITGGPVSLLGLDPEDTQGDKVFFHYIETMGCTVRWEQEAGPVNTGEWRLRVSREGPLHGGVFDLNATPDLLPVLAVLGAYAQGETALVNVAHARLKETDRIAVMARELGRLGAACTERPDGLIIRGSGGLAGGQVEGWGDHRVVMALEAAALGAAGPVKIAGAESAAVTWPGFSELTGADILQE